MKILSLVKYDLIKLSREKVAFVFMFLMPIFFISLFGTMNFSSGDNRIPVAMVNHDPSSKTTAYIEELKKDETVQLLEMTEEELIQKVRNNQVEAGFIFPGDFNSNREAGKNIEIEVVKLPSSQSYGIVQGIIQKTFAKMNMEKGMQVYFNEKLAPLDPMQKGQALGQIGQRLEENENKPDLVTVESKDLDTKVEEKNEKGRLSLGFTLMFLMFTLVFSAGEILEEKKNNTWGRLNITPTNTSTIILGKVLSSFARGWIQVLVLVSIGQYILGIYWGASILTTITVMSIFILCVTSMGLFLSSIVKTNAQLGAITSIVIVASSMLSGCYWPLEMVPDYMQEIAKFFPQYWAMQGVSGASEGMITPVAVLMGMGIFFFVLSTFNGRFRVGIKKRSHTAITGQ